MFFELVSGVKYPKITTVGLFFEATICGCFVVEPFFFFKKKQIVYFKVKEL